VINFFNNALKRRLVITIAVSTLILFSNNLIQESAFALTITSTVTIPAPTIGPSIISLTGSNPAANGYVTGAIITVQFSDPTNQPFKTTTNNHLLTADVNNLFSFSGVSGNTIGNSYTGAWSDPSTFVITIQDPGAVTGPTLINHLQIQVKSTANLINSAGTSLVSTSLSPVLFGDFGFPPAPLITAFVADDPNNGVNVFHVGDTLTIRFSAPTNQPGGTVVQSKTAVDGLFTFSQILGTSLTAYTGQWIDTSTFRITINDITGNTNPQIGLTTVSVNPSAHLKNSAGTSLVSTSTSPTLSGSFGTFTVSQLVLGGGTAVATLPSGISAQITLPPASAGTVTITKTTAPTTGSSGSALGFLGNVADISLPPGACQSRCTFSFTFTDDDLKAANIASPSGVVIFHDHNNDGDFKELDESLVTTVTPSTPPGPYTATATDDRTSKFAIGGVIPALAILGAFGGHGGGGIGAPPSFVSTSFHISSTEANGGLGGILASGKNPTNVVTTGTPVQLKLELSLSNGPSSIQHVGLYTNLNGQDREIQNSDTSVVYEPDKPLEISNPAGLLSSANVVTAQNGNYLDLVFNMTFAKPMKKSDVIIRAWDKDLITSDTKLHDVLEIKQAQTILPTTTIPQPVQPNLEKANQVPTLQIPVWVKNDAGWWSHGQIGDSDFTKGIQFLIEQGIMKIPQTKPGHLQSSTIPYWVKNNAGWWTNGWISDQEFISGIQYLITVGIIKTSN